MPDLSADEYQVLTDGIVERGLEYPIIIDDEGYITNGYNRYQIYKENGIELTDDDFAIRKCYSYGEKL
jgi:disulfide oxidoreductase YuzD